MCRNIKTLFNFDPPATDAEIQAAAIQFVRKIAGTTKPAKANVEAFDAAVAEVFRASQVLLKTMHPHGPPKDRAIEAAKAREKNAIRFQKADPAERVKAPLQRA